MRYGGAMAIPQDLMGEAVLEPRPLISHCSGWGN